MVLEQFNIPQSPITQFITILCNQLNSVVDTNNNKMNQSVTSGLDVVLQSAIAGKVAASECPCIRVFYDPNTITVSNNANASLYVNLPIQLYFLFNLDYPSSNFQELREDYIRWNLNYIKMNKFADGIGLPTYTWWKFNNETVTITHNTQLNYLGETINITPSSDYSCSRVDLSVMIKNYLGPDDRQLTA